MSTSSKIADKSSNDSIDRLIFEKNLRAKTVITDKDLDLILVIFNTGAVIKARLSDFSALKNADEEELKNWRLISGGVGIRWENIDEDISIKGLIKKAAMKEALGLLG